ncbi:MAG: AmmeMemoRadiSam system protein A [Eubacteriales bacterium]
MHLFITPHPPIILSEIGQGEETKANDTILGMQKIADTVAALKPKTIAIVSPHGHAFTDALCISTQRELSGDFGQFGFPKLRFTFRGSDQADTFYDALENAGIQAVALDKSSAKQYRLSTQIDHGALVPLSFIQKVYSDFDLLHIGMGFLSKEQTVMSGKILSDILNDDDVLVISGDLSHRLLPNAPAGYDEQGAVYDAMVVSAIKNKSYIDILDVPSGLLERAGQCAQHPLEMMVGVLDGYQTQTEVYSYQGPYGVGYMTAHIVRKQAEAPSVLQVYLDKQKQALQNKQKSEDNYVALARQTMGAYIPSGQIIPPPSGLPPEMYTEQRGVFVSIKKNGNLRGCIGTIEPVQSCIAEEIIRNAISAATRDPRFSPITPDELDTLEISVDVLFPPEDIDDLDELNPKEYGVIVNKGFRRGLLLPNLEGIDSAHEQVDIALQKAGIGPNERYKMQRFKVVRHI